MVELLDADVTVALKRRTVQAHRRLEECIPLMADTLTHAEYLAILKKFQGFVEPWEHLLATALPQTLRREFEGRSKSSWLRADLAALGASGIGYHAHDTGSGTPSRWMTLPDLHSPARLLGAAYVMEGSTLGGRLIVSHVARLLDLSEHRGCRFFAGYGERTGSMWKRFLALLSDAVDARQAEECIAAANDTFTAIEQWFRQPLPGSCVQEKPAAGTAALTALRC